MCENVSDINPMRVVVYCCNQTSFVPTNIENGQFAYLIGARESLAKLGKCINISMFDDPIPRFQRGRTIGMLCGKFE
jgi:hypothetical protein